MASELRQKHLYLDCFAGIAGDMFLGAALDLGVPEGLIREGLARLPLAGFELQVGRASRMGIEGCDVKVRVSGEPASCSVGGPHLPPGGGGYGHRSWLDIRSMIESSDLEEGAKQRALDIFGRLARAEGRLHGVTPDEVCFHEVGAIDSIVDIVGAALALDWLAPVRVTSRVVPLGHGTVRCAHGTLPVPSPAALEILAGAQVEDGGAELELCTPTGAAILASCVEAFGPIPAATLVATGYGAGDGSLPDRPNHLRLLLFTPREVDEAEVDAVVIEANVDDMSPEWCGHLMERLFHAGARDVWYTPIVMKKGRPAMQVSALCAASRAEEVGSALFAESTTIGLRYHAVGRRTLTRQLVQVQTQYGPVRVKVALQGEQVLNSAPELEDCQMAARRCGVPLKEVHAAAMEACRREAGQGLCQRK